VARGNRNKTGGSELSIADETVQDAHENILGKLAQTTGLTR